MANHNEYVKRRYRKMASEGRCVDCGTESASVRCDRCRSRRTEKAREIREILMERKLCTMCGHPLEDKTKKTCKTCRDKAHERYLVRKRREFYEYSNHMLCMH